MTCRDDGIFTVRDIDCPVTDYDWPFARDERDRIEAHWEELRRKNPALYNGRVLLMRDARIADASGVSTLRLQAFETDFANFLAWRDFGFPDATIHNCFSMAALRSADGAWLLGVMGEQTSNASQIYFPAGTPDRGDIFNGAIDFEGSAIRELREETGLDARSLQMADDWSVILHGPRIGCMKIITVSEDATTLCARIDAFIAKQKQPELQGMHIVRSRADIVPARMPEFMTRWLQESLP